MEYVCENENCPRAYQPVEVKHDQPADCPICGWSMTGV